MKKTNWRIILTATAITALAIFTWSYISNHNNEARLQQQLKVKSQLLQKNIDDLKRTQTDSKTLQQELDAVKAQLQARIDAKAQAVAYAETRVVFTGNCSDWLTQAGVTDLVSAMTLINRESGCNPYAVNKSSGSCNVAQELPCGKSGCQLGDGACSVKWMNSYVINRYGSWATALAHSYQYNWY